MNPVQVDEVKRHLRVIHHSDDALIGDYIASAQDEILRFCDRAELPTLPVDDPPEFDSDSSEVSEDVPSSDDPIAPSIRQAIYFLVQGYYEKPDPAELAQLRKTAFDLCWPYRARLGV